MGALVWVMVGIAIWHFTIFVPDHFWGGIVGAFLGALFGALVVGVLISGLDVPGQNDTNIGTALLGIPGSVVGIALVYFEGLRRDRRNAA